MVRRIVLKLVQVVQECLLGDQLSWLHLFYNIPYIVP